MDFNHPYFDIATLIAAAKIQIEDIQRSLEVDRPPVLVAASVRSAMNALADVQEKLVSVRLPRGRSGE